jgi:transcriptional regulator with XRE-family HTH domain
MTGISQTGKIADVARKRQSKSKYTPSVIGRNVRRLRDKHGLTQPELAERAGLKQGDISNLESGQTQEPSPTRLRKIKDALDEPWSQFFREPNAVERSPVLKSLDAFLRSGLADDITPDERELLEDWEWFGTGVPSPKAWYHLLEAMRATNKGAR